MLGTSHTARTVVGATFLLSACSVYTPELLSSSDDVGNGGNAGSTGGSNGCRGSSCAEAGPGGTSGKGGGSVLDASSDQQVSGDVADRLPLFSHTIDPPTISISLTTYGLSDWAHFGLSAVGDFNHKAGVKPLISKLTSTGSRPPTRKTDDRTTYEWSDGTPILSATTTSGVAILGADAGVAAGEGFEFAVPAGREFRKLRVWIGVVNAEAIVSGKFSDPRAEFELVDRVTSSNAMWVHEVLTVSYGYAAPNTTFTIRWVIDAPMPANNRNSGISLSAALIE